MSEMLGLIEDTAEKIFSDLCTKELVDDAEKGQWPGALWDTLEESGLTLAAIPEDQGGGGGSLEDSMAVIRQAARFAAPLPLAETFLAAWTLSKLGMEIPAGPLTIALPDPDLPEGEDYDAVPWAAAANAIVVLTDFSEPSVKCIQSSDATITPGTSLAGEPRDAVDSIPVKDARPLNSELDIESIRGLGALCRSVQMAGALEKILEFSLDHAKTRIQFGRPIGSFQAIRHQLAVLAGHAAAAKRAADVAIRAAENGAGALEIAAAKARTGEAAGAGAKIAHQVHGAIGMTHEHALHQYTRRIWAWRDEFGSETYWEGELGQRVADAGAENLWAFITQT